MTPKKEVELMNRVKRLEQMLETLTKSLKPVLPNPNKESYIGGEEAMELLGVKSTKFYSMLRNKELPFATKVGRKWRIPKSVLIRYIGNI